MPTKPTVDNLRTAGGFASRGLWTISFIKTAGSIIVPPGENGQDLNLRCKSVELPKKTGTPMPIKIRGQEIEEPGEYNYSKQFTIMFAETVNSVVSKFIEEWSNACWELDTGKQGNREEVELDVIATRLNSKNEQVFQYTYHGCFYKDADLGTLTENVSENFDPSLTLSYANYDYKELTGGS